LGLISSEVEGEEEFFSLAKRGYMNFIEIIISEMGKGNFSFLILIVELIQVILMIRTKVKRNMQV